MKKLTILVLMAAVAFSGCAWFSKSQPEKTAMELATDGMDEFHGGNYKDAIKSFEKIKDWYPFSKYAILAELKIGDANYQLQKYEDAIFAYQEFENLHPRNEAVPYVIYQTGRCYFDQVDTVDRDQAPAREALKTFRRLVRQFPGDAYAMRAEGHIRACLRSLAGHDYYVGHFYYRSKHYKAALQRFRRVVTEYPDNGIHYKALQLIPRCEALIARAAAEKKK